MSSRPWPRRIELAHLRGMMYLDDPGDLVRAAAVSRRWRLLAIQHRLCKNLFLKKFPRVTCLAYEDGGRYDIIRLSDVLPGDADDWKALELEHKVYSNLLQPRAKLMDCPRDCLLFPVGSLTKAEEIITAVTPCRQLFGLPFFSCDQGQPESRFDFIDYLNLDVCISIMSFIDNPADIVRVSAVSRLWRHFVIDSGLAKHLCLKELPQLSTVASVVIGGSGTSSSAEAGTSTSVISGVFEKEHTVYASLLHAAKRSMVFRKDCIQYAISASSTDRFPSESVQNTVIPGRGVTDRASFWTSKGKSSPQGTETLVYKLRPGLWLISEIDVQPFQAAWQNLKPIYSARSVRFRIGHPASVNEISSNPESFPLAEGADDKFVWTYTSPEYPMMQVSTLLPFKLPEPILCLDAYMQVELLDMVQRQEYNGLFHIRVNHVRAVGRPLSPAFEMEIEEESGEMQLMYKPALLEGIMKQTNENEIGGRMWMDRMRFLERMLPRPHNPANVLVHHVIIRRRVNNADQ